MNKKPSFQELLQAARNSLSYKVEGAIIQFTEQIFQKMQTMGVSKSELASRIGSSAPYVTKLLKGGTNFTLESMVKVADALDSEIRIELIPKFTAKDWIHLMEEPSAVPVEHLAWQNMRYKHEHGSCDVTRLEVSRPKTENIANEICAYTSF
jgi:transcriptional regulator with XRE-family HTH domain